MLYKSFWFKLLFAVILLLFQSKASLFSAENNIINSDSISYSQIGNQNSIAKIDKLNLKKSKSPSGAIWRSLALPGWGQYYVESYWKIPIFTGGVIASTYFIVNNHIKMNKKQNEINDYLSLNTENQDNYIHRILKNQREVYRDNRDQAIFVLAGFYIVAAIDAYVGAHLFEFDVNDDIGMKLQPCFNSHLGVNLSIQFK